MCDVVGRLEIGQRLEVVAATVDEWRKRDLLPAPTYTVSGRAAWEWPVIRRWAEATGRVPGFVQLPNGTRLAAPRGAVAFRMSLPATDSMAWLRAGGILEYWARSTPDDLVMVEPAGPIDGPWWA